MLENPALSIKNDKFGQNVNSCQLLANNDFNANLIAFYGKYTSLANSINVFMLVGLLWLGTFSTVFLVFKFIIYYKYYRCLIRNRKINIIHYEKVSLKSIYSLWSSVPKFCYFSGEQNAYTKNTKLMKKKIYIVGTPLCLRIVRHF